MDSFWLLPGGQLAMIVDKSASHVSSPILSIIPYEESSGS